jgi:hypothetical protein
VVWAQQSLRVEAETVSETDINSIITLLIGRKDLIEFIYLKRLKSCMDSTGLLHGLLWALVSKVLAITEMSLTAE